MGAVAAIDQEQIDDTTQPARVDRAVFAVDELGWIAEELQRAHERAGGIIEAIGDPRVAVEPVRRLSEHPRLLRIAQRHLGSRVAIVRCVVGAPPCDPPAPPGDLVLVLPLRRGAAFAIGDVVAFEGPMAPPEIEGPALSVVYRADPRATTLPRSDDCLWPPPWVVAG